MGLLDKIKDLNEMRKQGKVLQAQMSEVNIIGSSSGDKIKLAIDGNLNVKSVEVNPSITGDKSEVARHIRAALESLFKNYKKEMQKKFGNIMQ